MHTISVLTQRHVGFFCFFDNLKNVFTMILFTFDSSLEKELRFWLSTG